MELKNLFTIAITLGIAILVLSIITQVVTDFKADYKSGLASTNKINESIASLSNSSMVNCNLVVSGGQSGLANYSGTAIYSALKSPNISIQESGLIILYSGNFVGNASKFSYSCLISSVPFNVTGDGATGLLKISGWLPTLGLILGAIVVISALLLFYKFRKEE